MENNKKRKLYTNKVTANGCFIIGDHKGKTMEWVKRNDPNHINYTYECNSTFRKDHPELLRWLLGEGYSPMIVRDDGELPPLGGCAPISPAKPKLRPLSGGAAALWFDVPVSEWERQAEIAAVTEKSIFIQVPPNPDFLSFEDFARQGEETPPKVVAAPRIAPQPPKKCRDEWSIGDDDDFDDENLPGGARDRAAFNVNKFDDEGELPF